MNSRLLAKASVCALAASLAAPQALAQGAVEAFRDEILVTGTKKAEAENVQDVPLAVTAYGAEQLDALKVRELQTLSYAVPNVQLEDIGTTRGVANFSIRGLATNSSIPSIDPAVGTFVDGVYLGQNGGVVFDIFDLESIEVLRGPQGILFGRNVTGGAVLLNSKRPNLQEFEASFKAAVESGLRGTGLNYYAMGAVSGPIVQDTLGFRLTAYYNDDNGWHKRYLGGPNLPAVISAAGGTLAALQGLGFPIAAVQPDAFEDHGKAETWSVRPQLLWQPTDSVSINIKYERFESEGDGPSSQNHPGFIQPPFDPVSGTTPAPVPSVNFLFSAPKDSFTFSIDQPGNYDVEADSVTVQLDIDVPFGDGRITNIFGWRDSLGTSEGDIDATPFWLFHSFASNEHEQISNEFRYAGRFFDRMDFTAGFYYYTADHVYQENRFILGGFRNLFGGGIQDSRNYGVFGQIDFDLTDDFTLIGGVRYTNEKKSVELANITLNMAPCSIAAGTCTIHFTDEETWKNVTPKVGFRWEPRDDLQVYAHWTEGIRSGGYNFRNTSVVFPIEGFDEEEVDSYEIGFKAQPADGKATINAAFFVNDISDMQREINLSDPIAGVVQIIRNTADATIFGFELESRIFVTDNLIFTGNLGHLDGEYDSVLFDLNSDGVVNDTDLTLEIPRLAPWTYGAGFIHTLDLGATGSLSTRFNWSHRDDNAYTDNNLGILQGADMIDASIALTTFDNRATISIYGQNLLNEVTHGGETQLPLTLGGGSFAPLNKGRIAGVEVQVAF
ncbi:TonB-dependent receptor [Amphiplicatus metriothermophilus]|uniref:Iron complex outermembrane recepter protein n=1 Tax=Amphiplicatus metriothermophilus TaxID=1519374 RepID=A0A239PJY2_9PROT|nr:TonB-dependent receptor [Amphiplicatus metriothermophilus]MBB5517719.1 iron complex outermembrane receptor protein [Amphiplicatus metriothermophilus]SNT67947.1 iron complex outermembrane recepter protein [Amphiplicatus metriothermophilus]